MNKSTMTRILPITLALSAAFTLGAVVFAQQPPVDVGERPGNMRAAQQLIQQAWQKVHAAQQHNNYNLDSHAGRANGLLSQARKSHCPRKPPTPTATLPSETENAPP